jgi:predicted Fe-Mo cluster-binding NifX family protein
MNVAVPTLDDRVSPVFDVAQCVRLVELDGVLELRRQTIPLHARDITRRVGELSQHEVNVLICGAISRPLEGALCGAGIHVISQTCGAVDEVLRAFAEGRLNEGAFLMPGCSARKRRRQRGGGGGRRFERGRGAPVRSRRQNREADG